MCQTQAPDSVSVYSVASAALFSKFRHQGEESALAVAYVRKASREADFAESALLHTPVDVN